MTTTQRVTDRALVAIFEKDAMRGVLCLNTDKAQGAVTRFDPRCDPQVATKVFTNPADAFHWHHEFLIATVSDNGWKLLYHGARNWG